jgi:hypothetical protein
MKFKVFANIGELASAIHVVFSWMLLAFFGAAAINGTIHVTEINWSMGMFHPSPLSHTMPEEDFANLWSAGHLIRLGRIDWLYSPNLFTMWKQSQFDASLVAENWIYPPTVLLLGVPLSYLPLVPAFLLWDAGSLVMALFLLRWAGLSWPILLVGLLGPATWRSLVLGQYGTVTGALVIAGLLFAPRGPLRAGILLGLATLKPQQGIVVPVAWLAARYWRAIIAAGLTFGLLGGIVTAWLGWHAWAVFFANSSAMGRVILDAPPPQNNINTGVSVFWMCRTLGSSVAVAYAAQIPVTITAIILTYLAWRKRDVDLHGRIAFTVCASLMITPYGYTSDMVAFSIAVAMMVSHNRWRLRVIDVFLWLWPFYCTRLTLLSGILWTPLVVCVAAALAWTQLHRKAGRPGFLPSS